MSLSLRHAGLDAASTVDGPGVRTVVWFQGCSIRCPACQNKRLWGKWDGKAIDPIRLAYELVSWNRHAGGSHNYTITGGEPFDQAEELLMLLVALRTQDPKAHIVVYTGHTWNKLITTTRVGWRMRRLIIMQIDVLVDGPYKPELDNPYMQYVGSANQRPINVTKTLAKGTGQLIGIWMRGQDLVLENWTLDAMLSITDGAITMAQGWLDDTGLASIGTETAAPRCGQSERGTNRNGTNGNAERV